MNKNIFRTDFTTNEIKEAVFSYINIKKKSEFDEVYNSQLNFNYNKDICWYCNRKIEKYIWDRKRYGFFCSIMCSEVFFGNIWTMFNYVDKVDINLVPINIIENKDDIFRLIDDTKDFSKFKGYFYENNNNYYFHLKAFKDFNILYDKLIKIVLIYNNKRCLSCNSEIENNHNILKCDNLFISFCSVICKGSYLKLLERYIYIDEQINIYIPPIIFFEDSSEIINIIKNVSDTYIYGGLDCITSDNKIKITILTKR